jgi:hypothetical protein
MIKNDHIIIDAEIQIIPGENGISWEDTDKLGISVAVIWEEFSDRFRIYGWRDTHIIQKRLLESDKISGFNIWNFDFPLIFGLAKDQWKSDADLREQLLPKTNDILRRIWIAKGLDPENFSPAHRGWGLDTIARNTLGVGKIGHGKLAPLWHQKGEWIRLINYCCDDVALIRDLNRFICQNGFVIGPNMEKLAL